MNYIISATTDIGNTKETNQDGFAAKTFSTKNGKMVFAVLCDGMGGLAKGEVASSTVVKAFSNWADSRLPSLCEQGLSDSTIRQEWSEIISTYNEKIKDYGKRCGISLGTTVVAVLLTNNRYYIVNVGDSRAYEIFNSASVLTKDQTVVAREVELGNLTEEEAAVDPRRSVLLQCVGASDSVFPEFFFGETIQDAVYMLCSDGFRHEITADEIFEYLRPDVMVSEDTMKSNMDTLVNMNKQRAERDNITVLCIRTF